MDNTQFLQKCNKNVVKKNDPDDSNSSLMRNLYRTIRDVGTNPKPHCTEFAYITERSKFQENR